MDAESTTTRSTTIPVNCFCLALLLILAACSREPDWDWGVTEKIPVLKPVTDEAKEYLKGFTNAYPGVPPFPVTNGVVGDPGILGMKYCPPLNWYMALSYENDRAPFPNNLLHGRHLYLYQADKAKLEELHFTFLDGVILRVASIGVRQGQPLILFECSYTNRVQANFILVAGTNSNTVITNLGPGGDLAVSPDGTKVALIRSNERGLFKRGSGFYSIHIIETKDFSIHTAVALWESDSGSGESFHYRWSPDSKALLIEGSHCGFSGNGPGEFHKFKYLYFPERREMVDVSAFPVPREW